MLDELNKDILKEIFAMFREYIKKLKDSANDDTKSSGLIFTTNQTNDCDHISVEVFGGACRVLLNKPRHEIEIYNDSSKGLSAFFNLMSQKDWAEELIHRIYETEYSQDCFNWAVECRNTADDNFLKQTQKQFLEYLKQLCIRYDILPADANHREFVNVLKQENDSIAFAEKLISMLTQQEKTEYELLAKNLTVANNASGFTNFLDLPEGWTDIKITDILTDTDLAVATYVIYSQSRDAMGSYWTSSKYKTQDDYYKSMARLYDVAERFSGVRVSQPVNALTFLLDSSYINDEDAMMYLDPSYLRQEDGRNAGSSYKQSFDHKQHETLLNLIVNAKCKIVISNYSVDLYNYMLTPERGWTRVEYETNTSVGGKKNNKRMEVLWLKNLISK